MRKKGFNLKKIKKIEFELGGRVGCAILGLKARLSR